jgi:hypothetical protein
MARLMQREVPRSGPCSACPFRGPEVGGEILCERDFLVSRGWMSPRRTPKDCLQRGRSSDDR